MKLQLSDLKTERQWRAATGYDQVRFEKLLVQFTASYLNLYGCPVATRQAGWKLPQVYRQRGSCCILRCSVLKRDSLMIFWA